MKVNLHYGLNRLFYDLHTNKSLAEDYRRDRRSVIDQYGIPIKLVIALLDDDIPAIAPHTNGFLMRYYFIACGISEGAFLAGLQNIVHEPLEAHHG